MALGQPGGGGRRRPLSVILMAWMCQSLHYSEIVKVDGYFTSALEFFSNGLCPRLHISYMRHPKLHTSLAVEYFL